MKKLIFLLGLVLLGNSCFAFNIVYPKKNDVTVNAQSTFFIGSSDKPLKINGKDVTIHPSGGFAYVVPLNSGKNTFVIQSGDERQIYVITKPIIKSICSLPPQFIPYKEKRYYYVTTEGAPLRSTPVNAGINRMAHLQRNLPLTVDGENRGFYRVVLAENKFGWISKADVKTFADCKLEPAEMFGYDYIDSEDYFTFVFHLSSQVPYEMIEGDPFLMKFYNIKDNPDNTYVMDFPIKDALSGRKLIGYSGEYKGNDFVLKIRKPIITNDKKPLRGITIAVDAGHGESVVFVSIHGNALPDGMDPNKISGTSIYYYYNQSKPLADILLNTMTAQLGTNNDKVRQASLAVVRNTNALSVLIETAYLINPDDNAKLINPEFQKNCAKAIADGLEEYFSK